MAGIAFPTADPIPAAGPATGASLDNPGGAGLFGDALGAAVADSLPPAPDASADPTAGEDTQAPAVQPSMLGAAGALAALLGRITGDAPASTAPPSTPSAPSAAVTAQAPAAAPAPSASEDVAATTTDPAAALEPRSVKPGTKARREADATGDAASASPTTPTITPTPADGAAVLAPAVPVVPVVPAQPVAGPVPTASGSARDGKVGAAGRPAGAADARTVDAEERSAGTASVADPAASPPDASSTAVAATPAATPAAAAVADPSVSAIAAVAPAQQTVPTAGPAVPQPVAQQLVATTDPSVAQQLQGPLVALRSAPDGDHVMVVRVSPEHLGSVTVHATVSHGDLSVQLIASTTDGHDALQSMMTDLRRDLGAGGSGTATTLSLSTGDAPQQDPRGQAQTTWVGTGAGGSSSGGGSAAQDDRLPRSAAARAIDDTTTDRRLPASSSALLDVLA